MSWVANLLILRKDGHDALTFGGYRLDTATRQLLLGKRKFVCHPGVRCAAVRSRTGRGPSQSRNCMSGCGRARCHGWPHSIAELRTVLHDSADAPAFIRTVRRFGYSFCGDVSATGEAPATRICWIILNGREIALHNGDNIIGRDPGVTVRIDTPSVSRRHARILVSANDIFVEDLGSKNGTFIRNDRLTGTVRLADLDEVQVGSARLVVRILSGDVKTQTIADR